MKLKLNRFSRKYLGIVGGVTLLTSMLGLTEALSIRQFSPPTFASLRLNKALAINPSPLEVARGITVRIFSGSSAGSGVIISRQGNRYQVLTSAHVLTGGGDSYEILTPDGQIQIGRTRTVSAWEGIDLALLEFQSNQAYKTAVLGNIDQMLLGDPIYISGFPNYHPRTQDHLEITYDWGVRAFNLTTGEFSMYLSDRSLQRGYKIAYTNRSRLGMSGGPVLNQFGELVGINGRGPITIQGIEALRFADGTLPSQELFNEMSSFSWAIPITRIQEFFGN